MLGSLIFIDFVFLLINETCLDNHSLSKYSCRLLHIKLGIRYLEVIYSRATKAKQTLWLGSDATEAQCLYTLTVQSFQTNGERRMETIIL